MKDEMNSMANNQVWDLIELPKGANAIVANGSLKLKETPRAMLNDIK